MIGHMNRFSNLLVDYYIINRLAKENPGAADVADKILTFVGLVVWFGFIIFLFLHGVPRRRGRMGLTLCGAAVCPQRSPVAVAQRT